MATNLHPMRPNNFTRGDVVYDIDEPSVYGIVTEIWLRSVTVVWEHGGRSSGPGLLRILRPVKPMARILVPAGALGHRGWNREQSVRAAFRRMGIRASVPRGKEG